MLGQPASGWSPMQNQSTRWPRWFNAARIVADPLCLMKEYATSLRTDK
jgi:hypothetical protein